VVSALITRSLRPLKRHLASLARDRKGVSALEFALILPVLLILYFGTDELGEGLTVQRKVTHVTSSIGDLVTQSKTISSTDMENFFDAAESIIIPYNVNKLKMTVTALQIDASGNAKVVWSHTRNGTALTANAPYTGLPDGVKQASTFLITAKVTYDYTPTIGYLLTGTFTITDQFYLRPRQGSTIAAPA
jgi:Flp pilus assembly protein TadG